MSRIAFFAPMKSPRHLVPSGDREFARAVSSALQANPGGVPVELVSEFRCYEGQGNEVRQTVLIKQALEESERLVVEGRKRQWAVWVSYHNYYKAPDLLGPTVASRLNIPYVLVEASRSKKRLNGKWAKFARKAEEACDQANLIFFLTQRDRVALAKGQTAGQKLVHLKPFLNRPHLPPAAKSGPLAPIILAPIILAVGMMRKGDKLASYQLIADTLEHLQHPGWHLQIAGDGPARPTVKAMFRSFPGQVTFLGQLNGPEMHKAYQASDLFFWPGVNEAFGMAYLESQSYGLPVVAQDRPGVREVVLPGLGLVKDQGPQAMAEVIDYWLGNPATAAGVAQKSRRFVADHHLLPPAANVLWHEINELVGDTL